MKALVQVSLDVTSIDEALELAHVAIDAGVSWLEAGTPLIIAEGMHGVRALRRAFPEVPIVADLKTMDGGYLEATLMADAGATHVVVMGQACPETIELVVRAGHERHLTVMGDNLGMSDPVAGARLLHRLGCDVVVHHVAYDRRVRMNEVGRAIPSPLEHLAAVVASVPVPVQAVGGLTAAEAAATPSLGAPLVVIGAPLAIDEDAFKAAGGDVGAALRAIVEAVHAYGDVRIGGQA
ncbi:orotidine 5'-phosphate decarboxylase [soil metagenome]